MIALIAINVNQQASWKRKRFQSVNVRRANRNCYGHSSNLRCDDDNTTDESASCEETIERRWKARVGVVSQLTRDGSMTWNLMLANHKALTLRFHSPLPSHVTSEFLSD